MRATIAQKLARRQAHTPGLLYSLMVKLVMPILSKKLSLTFTFKAFPGKDKGPFVLISNHASRIDYLYTAPACWPRKLNYVVGYNEFFLWPTSILLNAVGVIPKKNFTPDVHSIKQMMNIISQGGCICIMPEGMSSITGMAQPVMPGGGALLKKLGVNVYYTKISGGYLANTKHYLKQRNGKTEVVVDQMFTGEELSGLTPEEIEDRMNSLLAHDDYIWNKEKQYSYDDNGDGMAAELDTLLYMCPKCGAMHKMLCEGNTMRCTECGNTISIDNKYNISAVGEGSVCPPLVTDWTIMERSNASEEVRKPGFRYSGHVRIGRLPEFRKLGLGKTSRICGDGTLSLDTKGLHFEGHQDGCPLSFDIHPSSLPTFGMCTDISRFYTFIKGEFIEFFPDRRDALRWDHLVEEMHRFLGGKWQNTQYRHFE